MNNNYLIPRSSLARVPWWTKAIITATITAVLSVLGAIYTVNYTSSKTDRQSITDRVTIIETRQQKLEAHQQDDHEILTHIQEQVDRLTEWALGKK